MKQKMKDIHVEIKSKITKAKAASKKEKNVFSSRFDQYLRMKLV
jgi:hypothetical protein